MQHVIVSRRSPKLVIILSALVCVLALLNLFSPLRLNTDGIRYFSMMLYAKGLLSVNDPAGTDFYPHGYPLLLQALDKLCVLNGLTIVLLNFAGVACAAYFVSRLGQVKQQWLLFTLLLLSFVYVKHLTLPVADELFTGIMYVAIYCWSVGIARKRWYVLLLALILSLVSIKLRTAGIVIIGGMLVYFADEVLRKMLGSYRFVLLIALVAIIAVVFVLNVDALASKIDYFRQLQVDVLVHQPLTMFGRLAIHFKEVGELILNIPSSKIGSILHLSNRVADALLIIIGLMAFTAIIYGGFKAGLFKQPVGYIYGCYLLMVFVWPFYDARFLIPALPLFIYSLYSLGEHKGMKLLLKLVLALYIIMGLLSLSYSAVMSVNRQYFLKLYGNDKELSEAYKQHFDQHHPKPEINRQRMLYILDTYDR